MLSVCFWELQAFLPAHCYWLNYSDGQAGNVMIWTKSIAVYIEFFVTSIHEWVHCSRILPKPWASIGATLSSSTYPPVLICSVIAILCIAMTPLHIMIHVIVTKCRSCCVSVCINWNTDFCQSPLSVWCVFSLPIPDKVQAYNKNNEHNSTILFAENLYSWLAAMFLFTATFLLKRICLVFYFHSCAPICRRCIVFFWCLLEQWWEEAINAFHQHLVVRMSKEGNRPSHCLLLCLFLWNQDSVWLWEIWQVTTVIPGICVL